MFDKITAPAVRQWLYGVVTAALPLLVVFGVVRPEDSAMWLALAGAVLGTGTAFVALTKQRKDGTL